MWISKEEHTKLLQRIQGCERTILEQFNREKKVNTGRYCPKCFTELPEKANYCPTCGKFLKGFKTRKFHYPDGHIETVTIGFEDKAIKSCD